MPLDFSINGYENLFKNALKREINIFCGAGFSVEAEDDTGKKLPIGAELLEELKEQYPVIQFYNTLSRACTKITQTDRATFHSFLKQRFHVNKFSPLYLSLLKLKIKNIYTTNIDDLFFKIYEASPHPFYLNDRSKNGATYKDNYAVHYYPLHGCIRSDDNYVFGAQEIASAFSRRGSEQSWQNLAEDSAKHPILFWGWNFSDTGPIEAMYGNGNRIENNTERWVLLHKADPETIDFLTALKFNIIVGDTMDMLEYISELTSSEEEINTARGTNESSEDILSQYKIPSNNESLPSYPLSTFFLEYTPQWSHIYSCTIPKTICYKKIADAISTGKDVIVIGIRGAGKTTLMMQLLADYETNKPKHYLIAPSNDQAQTYIKLANGRPTILFVDDCFRDTSAVLQFLESNNIQVICFDRDFNYERQFHKIQAHSFEIIEVSEITKEDAQSISNIIPAELKRDGSNNKDFEKDPTILTLLASNLKSVNFKFIDTFYKKDPDAARVFLMISYVHACGTPCSFDMIYSFLGDEKFTWQQMYDIVNRIGKLINEISDNYLSIDVTESVQNYYQCRSRFFAEKIINNIPKGNKLFAEVLFNFAQYVLPYKTCMYDKFKRRAYDADFAYRAFPKIEEGSAYYNLCTVRDNSEYIYQQAALYFSRNKKYKTAFNWIDKARNLAHYNRFSIDGTYAKIYFDANIDANREQTECALSILRNCCANDKRKSIHFSTFAKCCLKFHSKYRDEDSISYIKSALEYLNEGLDDANLSLSNKNKRELNMLRIEIEKQLTTTTSSGGL